MGDREDAGGAETTPRQEEATTSETLGDLKSTRTCASSPTSNAASSESSSATENSTPSPDGAFDSGGGGRADGSDAGELM